MSSSGFRGRCLFLILSTHATIFETKWSTKFLLYAVVIKVFIHSFVCYDRSIETNTNKPETAQVGAK